MMTKTTASKERTGNAVASGAILPAAGIREEKMLDAIGRRKVLGPKFVGALIVFAVLKFRMGKDEYGKSLLSFPGVRKNMETNGL